MSKREGLHEPVVAYPTKRDEFRPLRRRDLKRLMGSCPTERKPDMPRLARGPFLITKPGLRTPSITAAAGAVVYRNNYSAAWTLDLKGAGEIFPGLPVLRRDVESVDRKRSSKVARKTTMSRRPPWCELRYLPTILPPAKRSGRRAYSRNSDRSWEEDLGEAVMKVYPWHCIGKVFGGTNPDFQTWSTSGTGTLIGPSTMITASHLVPWGVDFFWVKFVPAGFDTDEPFGFTWATQIRQYPPPGDGAHDRYRDLAVCRLLDPLGDSLGWMGTQSSSGDGFYQDTDAWYCNGYPDYLGGATGFEWFVGIDEIDRDGNAAQLQCDNAFTTPGWSGGPLWGFLTLGDGGSAHVIGVVSGVETEPIDDTDAIFSGGGVLTDLAIQARNDWG